VNSDRPSGVVQPAGRRGMASGNAR